MQPEIDTYYVHAYASFHVCLIEGSVFSEYNNLLQNYVTIFLANYLPNIFFN